MAEPYKITNLTELFPGVFHCRLTPIGTPTVFPFKAGQFVQLTTEQAANPHAAHMFSIASSPNTKDYLEICFRVYGPWTTNLSTLPIGTTIYVSGPYGIFTWDPTLANVVFLAGGVGIVPMLSMLRFLVETHQTPRILLFYGNRTADSRAYYDELTQLIEKLPGSKLVDVLSDVSPTDQTWQGYTGFMTPEILQKEGAFSDTIDAYYYCGPPAFVAMIRSLLLDHGIDPKHLKAELYASPPPPKQVD